MSGFDARLAGAKHRRERLVALAGAQRAAVADGFRRLQGPIGVIDRGIEVGRYLRDHPVVVAAAVAILMALRPRRFVTLAGSAFSAWRVWRTVSAWAAKTLV